MKNNNHKKMVFQDNFIKNWCCSSDNHPEGWHWWKKHNRKTLRLKIKHETADALMNQEDDSMDERTKIISDFANYLIDKYSVCGYFDDISVEVFMDIVDDYITTIKV